MRAFGRPFSIFILTLASFVSAAAHAASEAPQTAFYRANALYAEGQYADAARAYEELAAAGYDGGALRFNLGNAYFKSGDIGRALLNFERAATWIPGDPDLEANLSYLRSLTGAEACRDTLPARTLFPLAARADTWSLAVWATALATLSFLALAAARWFDHRRRVFYGVAAVTGIAWLVTVASLGYRVATVERGARLVVLAAEESAVRFEPASDGTVHFSVPQGTVLSRTDVRRDWTQVARCDGRRGWIESVKVEAL